MTRAEDELEVRNVVARLALSADGGEVEEYVSLFAPDASWEMPGAPRRGQSDIRAGSEERRASGATGPGTQTRHVVTTLAVQVDGDSATADSYWLFYVDTATAPRLQGMGSYHDTFVRMAGGWKLARRQITFG